MLRTTRRNVEKFTEADLERRTTLAEAVCEMIDGVNPVRPKDVAEHLVRNYGTVQTHLHLVGEPGLLKRVDRKGWLQSMQQCT